MQVYLTPSDRTLSADADRVLATAGTAARDLLVVSGEVDAQGAVRLNPLKITVGTPRPPDPGPYLLRITTSSAVIEQPFASREIDHDGTHQRFGFTLAHPGTIERIDVLRDGRVVQQRAARARPLAATGTAAAPAPQTSEHGGALTVRWDAARQPYLTVTHVGAARTVIAVDVQGGSTTLPTAALPAGGQFELGLSDGLNVERVLVGR